MGVNTIEQDNSKVNEKDDLNIYGTNQLNINGIIYYCRQIFSYDRRTFHPTYHKDVLELMQQLCEREIMHKIEFNKRRKKYIATLELGGANSSCTHEDPLFAICIAVALMVRAAKDEEPT